MACGWGGQRLEDVATPEAFARQPDVVQRFYDLRRRQLLAPDIGPNAAHRALAELERRWPGQVQIVTQNIDDLHERAGSSNLIHMHGELLKARCTRCAAVCPWRSDLAAAHRCPACGGADVLRPHVVDASHFLEIAAPRARPSNTVFSASRCARNGVACVDREAMQ
jgi:NAD-dependent deacetylase